MMGVPHYRLKSYISVLGISLSESTMFNMSEDLANASVRIHLALEKEAANSFKAGIDDTRMKILNHQKSEGRNNRSSTRTTGVVAELEPKSLTKQKEVKESNKICLFKTGDQVAGEYFDEILSFRNKAGPIILMADALKDNNPKINIDLCDRSSCLVHARRNFWNIEANYPEIVPEILDLFSEVFGIEKRCKEENLFGKDRLDKHKKESSFFMASIWVICWTWLKEKKVEPKSSLGKAMKYFLNHFYSLCRFLKVEDCPIENNETERLLKKMIQHRKNSLFYKTNLGAMIGDIIMSLGFTALEAGVSSQEYFEDILLNFDKNEDVKNWLPWNWKSRKENLLLTEESKVA